MKPTLYFILLSMVLAQGRVHGQIHLSFKNIPLGKVLRKIQRVTGYDLIYNAELVKKAGNIHLEINNLNLQRVLDSLLYGKGLSYTLSDKVIVIKEQTVKNQPAAQERKVLLPVRIEVQVRDTAGNAISGAAVRVPGTGRGGFTDQQGILLLTRFAADRFLQISMLGYGSAEIAIDEKSHYEAVLKEISTSLDNVTVEVIHTGYQAINHQLSTGSYAVVNKAVFEQRVGSTVLDRMEGIASGFLINRDPSGGTSYKVRGVSTINADPSPLIVLDNFPYEGNLDNINPNSVENITVLKDAAAASIWGARAGNGVIVITTKKAKFDRALQVELVSSLSFSAKPDLSSKREWLGSKPFIALEEELFKRGFYDGDLSNNSNYPVISPVVEILAQRRSGKISNEQASNQINFLQSLDSREELKKYFYRGMVNRQYALYLRAGNQHAAYLVSLGYDANQSNAIGNEGQRFTLLTHILYRPVKAWEFSGSLDYAGNHHLENSIVNTINSGGVYSKSLYPYASFADGQGNPLAIVKDYRYGFAAAAQTKGLLNWLYYPLKEKEAMDHRIRSDELRAVAGLSWQPVPGLKLEGLYQYQSGRELETRAYSDSAYYSRNLINQYSSVLNGIFQAYEIPAGEILKQYFANYHSHNARLQLSMDQHFKRDHFQGILGVEAREVISESLSDSDHYGYSGQGGSFIPVNYTAHYLLYPSQTMATIPNNYYQDQLTNRYRSWYANVSYAFRDRYILSASARMDQANLFGVSTNKKQVPLYSFGAKWDISQEGFFHKGFIGKLQLKASWGFTGNLLNNGTAYTTAIEKTQNMGNNFSQNYYLINAPGNPELSWEKTRIINFGCLLELWDGRIHFSIDYYLKKGTGLIGRRALPSSSGFASALLNYAGLKASGLDLDLESRILQQGAFRWDCHFLLSYTADRVSHYGMSEADNGNLLLVGKPVNALFSYYWAGLDPINGNPRGLDGSGQLSQDYASLLQAGPRQMQYSGSSIPKFYGGFSQTIRFGQWSLSANLSFKCGYYFKRSTLNYYQLFYSWKGNRDYNKRWQQPGDEKTTSVPSLPALPADPNRDAFYGASTAVVSKGDHIRFQDICISYEPEKTKKNHLIISLSASNLGILWRANHYGIDPDFQQADYLPPKLFSIGLKASF